MGVIVVASNKGGVGKTTIAILLSEELARRGYRVAVVEADEERHIANYLATRENNDVPCNFTLTSDEDPATLGKTIKTTEAEADIVVVDLALPDGSGFTLISAVRALPQRQREVMVLRYFLDLSEAEIAEWLGVSPGSVKRHAFRAVDTLQKRMEAWA